MLDPFERGKVWYIYSELEREFIETTAYVALELDHRDVWSEKFGELLIRAGSSVGSFFNLMVNDDCFNEERTVINLREKMERREGEWTPNITDFREAFNPIFELSSARVEASYGLTYYGRLQPFKDFQRVAPNWWDAHNKLKHQFYEKLEERAKLSNALDALAGLFLLNVLHKGSRTYLVRYTNVIKHEWITKRHMEQYMKESFVGVPKSLADWGIRAETPLFAHVYRVDKKVEGGPVFDDT